MNKIKWSTEYLTGIDIIDYQNSELINKFNELLETDNKSYLYGHFESFFTFLLDYTYYCFKIEEKYFDNSFYSEKESHIREHRRFIKDIILFQSNFLKVDTFDTELLLSYITNWIENHILIMDKIYFKTVTKK